MYPALLYYLYVLEKFYEKTQEYCSEIDITNYKLQI